MTALLRGPSPFGGAALPLPNNPDFPDAVFAADNILMFFNDGKKAFLELAAAVKES